MIDALLLEAEAIATSLNRPIIPDTLREGTCTCYIYETHVNSLEISKIPQVGPERTENLTSSSVAILH